MKADGPGGKDRRAPSSDTFYASGDEGISEKQGCA